MDYMDIDQVSDVPDTPDRLPVQNIDGRVFIEKESDSSVVSHSGNTNFLDGGARNRLRGKTRLVTDGGHSRRLSFRHGKNLSSSNKSEPDSDFTVQLGSSLKDAHLFRRMVADKTANHENKYSLHSQRTEKGKTPCTSQSSIHRDNGLVDLTEQSEPAQVFQKAFQNRASGVQHANEIRDGLTSTNGFSSLHGMANPSMLGRNTSKGKEKMDDTGKGVSGIEPGKGIFGDPQPKAAKNIPVSFHSISSPRVSGQKRLVRNGCISPHNIAKAKQSSRDLGNGPMDFQNDKEIPVSDCSSSLIRDLIAEDNNSHRGQGVISHLFSSKQPDSRTTSNRCSITHNEEASETGNASGDAFKCFEGLGGWRSTRNRTKKINLPLSDEVQLLSRTKDDQFVSQQTENRGERRDNENGRINRIDNDYCEDQNAVSFQHGSASTVSQAVSCPIPHLDQVRGSRMAASTLKRQKQGFVSSNRGESSTSSSVDSEVVFLGSSGEPSNSRSNRNQNGRGPGILDPVIEIDEFSPEIGHGGPHNMGHSSNDDSDARAIQVQADEILARELQEQLYNEAPGVGDGEIDAHIALALQQEGTSQHAFSSGTHPVFHPRGSILSNFYRQSQSRSSQNPSVRRGTQARGPVVSSRFTRLRSRLPSQSPRIRYRERNSVFPANMDLDMRIHILEALEAFSDMGMSSNFLQVDREFTEDDYEMLLALDENNHQHGGASLDQINGLPQSTVQGDNFEEACAICLETPSSGDTIRHLPCLHKFHKDCIDPWLRRKTSCPVCKSSVT